MVRNRSEFYLLCLLTCVLAAAVVWMRTLVVKNTYHYVQQENEYRKLQTDIQNLRVGWVKLTSPKRLQRFASALELYPPSLQQIVKYDSSTKATQ